MSITKLKLNADIKDIGRIITANPDGDAIEQLTKLGINGTIYEVVGNGGGLSIVEKNIRIEDNNIILQSEFTNADFEKLLQNQFVILHHIGDEQISKIILVKTQSAVADGTPIETMMFSQIVAPNETTINNIQLIISRDTSDNYISSELKNYVVKGGGGGGVATITKAISPVEDEETFQFDEEFTAEEFETLFNGNAILNCVYAPVEGIAQNLYLYKNMSIQQVQEENSTRVVFLQTTQAEMTFSVSITNVNGEIGAEFSVSQPLELENYTFNANDENWSDIELDFSNRVNRIEHLQNAVFIVSYRGIAYFGRAENSEFITFKLNENTTRYFNIANGTFNDVLSDNELNLNYMGAWISDNEYFKNDLVLDTTDNQIYICVNEIIDGTTAPSNDNANWHLFIPTANVFIGVEISDVPSTATSGTLTETQLDLLTKNDNNYIMFAHEKYYLNDKGHTEGFLTYSHLGATSDNIIAKTITITLSTRAWVLLEEQVGGSSSGGIVELEELPSVVDESSPNLVLVRGIIYEKVANNVLGEWTFKDEFPDIGGEEKFFYVDGLTSGTTYTNEPVAGLTFKNNTINFASSGGSSSGFLVANSSSLMRGYKNIKILGGNNYLNNELGVLLEQFATKVSVNPYIYIKVNEEDILVVKNQNDRYILPIEYQNVERLKRTKFYYYHNNEYYSLYAVQYGKMHYGQEKVKEITTVAGNTGRHCGISGAVVQVDLANWQVSYNSNYAPKYLFTMYTEKPNISTYIPQLGKYLQIQSYPYTYQISAESVDFNTLLSIPNTATNGTITSAMLTTLQISDENYIILNNEIYLLQDKNTTDGFLVYTHNGHDSNGAFFQKCITITISTLGWVLNATQIATTSDIDNAIGNALQGDY